MSSSKVYDHYALIDPVYKRYRCNYCSYVGRKIGSTTSNMVCHLRSKHPGVYHPPVTKPMRHARLEERRTNRALNANLAFQPFQSPNQEEQKDRHSDGEVDEKPEIFIERVVPPCRESSPDNGSLDAMPWHLRELIQQSKMLSSSPPVSYAPAAAAVTSPAPRPPVPLSPVSVPSRLHLPTYSRIGLPRLPNLPVPLSLSSKAVNLNEPRASSRNLVTEDKMNSTASQSNSCLQAPIASASSSSSPPLPSSKTASSFSILPNSVELLQMKLLQAQIEKERAMTRYYNSMADSIEREKKRSEAVERAVAQEADIMFSS